MGRITCIGLLAASLLLLARSGAAVAQELSPSPVDGHRVTYVTPQSHIVVKITRLCRGHVCVRVLHVNEALDDIAAAAAPTTRPAWVRGTTVEPVVPTPPWPAQTLHDAQDPPDPPEQLSDHALLRSAARLLPSAPAQRSGPTCGSAEETAAWRLLNAYRAESGLAALTCDALALEVARGHGRDMCARRYFSHYTPEGTAPWDRLRAAGARFRQAGENIAVGYDTAQGAHDGWVASDGHRRNMLTAVWTRAAVGVVDCDGNRYWTQVFAR